ncbi:uncharacterized protein LOC124363600 [Homalodisca vitripennis]|uniref:uncharacterized protein LOC124363600 n=1 Tax=Homalodisca vitripennis TaxID=197043 RepID=UPI001EEA4A36|nr:uncharacterized protein LOC124363600 [Homalodisca vitripennis]
MAVCDVCVKPVKSNQVKLQCSDCKKEFHAQCYNYSRADVECLNAEGLPWRCKPCSAVRRKSLRFDAEVTEGSLTLEDVMQKIIEIADNQKKQEADFNKAYEHMNEKLEENTRSVIEHKESIDKCLKIVDEIIAENNRLTRKVSELERKIEDMEQYSRLNAVEIHGVPESKNEDVVQVIKDVGKGLDMDITDSMIDACHRLGRRSEPGSPPPGIILKFVRRLDKEELLKKRRVKSNFSTRHMNWTMDQPVYLNESLSPTRRRLFAEARKAKKDKGYRFLWVRNGKILMRKEEKSPVI